MSGRMLWMSAALVIVVGSPATEMSAQQLDEAQTAFRTGRYDDAIDLFRRTVRRDGSSAEAARGLVSALREVGRYDDAGDAAERFRRANENSAELANSLGELLYLRGDREGAERAFRRASRRFRPGLAYKEETRVLPVCG